MTCYERVPPALARNLAERGYHILTPVQQAVLAVEPADRDLIVSARTGSGKTVAFGLVLARRLLDAEGRIAAGVPSALVVTPTRELAQQVRGELEWLLGGTGARVACCTGGMDMRAERVALAAGADIVVGSPGRLRDHIERGAFDTARIASVVLDEADDMLDMGFRDDLEFILDATPATRQTLLFSATIARSVERLARRYQRSALRIDAGEAGAPHADILHEAVLVAPNDRENAIVNLLRFHEAQRAIVFCSRRESVGHLASRLDNRGFKVVALSGALSQRDRSHALQTMRDGRARVCVATDVAARGLDLPGLELVIQAELPPSAEILLHRAGRTGRAGRKGRSVLVVPLGERRRAARLLRESRIAADWTLPPAAEAILTRDRERILAELAQPEVVEPADLDCARSLLASRTADEVVARLLNRLERSRPVPEHLIGAPGDFARTQRHRFEGGVWFRVELGRKDRTDIRWLLPLICRAGHVTKAEIGLVRIHDRETHFEIEPAAVPRFIAAVARRAEPEVVISRIAGPVQEHPGCPDPIGRAARRPRPND
jgi:ATP-dependent RNA helicase DeaD